LGRPTIPHLKPINILQKSLARLRANKANE